MATENILFEHRIPNVPSNWNSLFIPMLPNDLIDEGRLKYLIEFIYGLGKVKRIDFTKKENSNTKYMAFIHFDYWNNNDFTQSLRERLQYFNLVDLNYIGFIDHKTKFIRFMINKTPIKDTEMNAPQLANELEIKIKEISEKDKEIEELKNKIAQLENENIKLHNILYNVSENENKFEETTCESEWTNLDFIANRPILTRETNEPVNITHLLYVEINDIDNENQINEYYKDSYLIGNDEYVNQINFMLLHLLNVKNFKKIQNIRNISIYHHKNNMFAIKFNTTNNVYISDFVKSVMYDAVVQHIQSNLKLEKNENVYNVNVRLVKSYHM